MTRRAKERRMERVQDKQRADEKRMAQEEALSSRPEWCALLAGIDGVVEPTADDTADNANANANANTKANANAKANANDNGNGNDNGNHNSKTTTRWVAPAEIADRVQWKSTQVPIAAASVLPLPINVDACHAVLHYEFSTRDFDVSFGVRLVRSEDGAVTELLPPRRYESQTETVTGELSVDGPGLLLLVWDNSYSWLTGKHLAYTIELQQDVPLAMAYRGATPAQRVALARHERLKREKLQAHKVAERQNMELTIEKQEQEIEFIKHQLLELQKTLETTEQTRETNKDEKDSMDDAISALAWEIDALTWRSFDENVTSTVYGFCEDRDLVAWSMASRTWQRRISAYRVAQAESVALAEVAGEGIEAATHQGQQQA